MNAESKPIMTHVAVFDLDGTLTQTSSVDAECFLAALSKTFGVHEPSDNWSQYPDATGSGILADIVTDHRGWKPSPEERATFIANFVTLLTDANTAEPDRFVEVPGARDFLDHLQVAGWTIAIATGGWLASANCKLRYAGFGSGRWPMATADDSRHRPEIVQASLRRAGVALDDPTNQIVVFGDALWDVQAARHLGLPLVIVGEGKTADELLKAGASATVPHFRNIEMVERSIVTATEHRVSWPTPSPHR